MSYHLSVKAETQTFLQWKACFSRVGVLCYAYGGSFWPKNSCCRLCLGTSGKLQIFLFNEIGFSGPLTLALWTPAAVAFPWNTETAVFPSRWVWHTCQHVLVKETVVHLYLARGYWLGLYAGRTHVSSPMLCAYCLNQLITPHTDAHGNRNMVSSQWFLSGFSIIIWIYNPQQIRWEWSFRIALSKREMNDTGDMCTGNGLFEWFVWIMKQVLTQVNKQ